MSRRALSFVLAAILAAVPAIVAAQDPFSVGSISGRAIDAAGRGVGPVRVELLQGTHPVNVGTTNAFGEWSFRGVKPGEYVVRVTVRGRIAGTRVSIMGGHSTTGTLIVVPTASVAPQLGTLASLIASIGPTVGATVAATATAAAVNTETTQLNDVILEKILQELTPAERVAFANAVLEAIREAGTSNSPFQQYTAQLNTIVASQGTTVPDFPPPTNQAS